MSPDRIHAGLLRNRVTLQQQTPTTSTSGASITGTWTDYGARWAYIEQRAGGEQAAKDRLESTAAYQVIMRYDSGINSRMRISYAGKTLHIANVEDYLFRHQWLVLDCVEGRSGK